MRNWILFAICTRLIASYTQLSWGHPDEWYQTVEQANFLAHGFIAFTEGLSFHLRNLTWPAVLAGVLKLSQTLAPGDVSFRLWMVRLTTVTADLSTLWAIHAVIRRWSITEKMSKGWQKAAWICLVFPWFLIWDSVRPSQEHLSQIAFWWALGSVAQGWFFAAGIFSALTGVFRYPSALLGVGVVLMLLLRPLRLREAGLLLGGGLVGVFLGGLADWAAYGRPYESLWMYAQYNLFSGLGARNYGAQSGIVYLEYFYSHWIKYLWPIGIPAACLALVGLYYGIRKREVWAGTIVIYVLGHLFIGHKEPRFMAPIELALVLSAVYGAWGLRLDRRVHRLTTRFAKRIWVRRAVLGVVGVVVLVNSLLVVKALWGETFRPATSFLEMNRHMADSPHLCAVLTVKKPLTPMLPWVPGHVPSPAFAFFPAKPHSPVSPQAGELAQRPVIWFEKKPECKPGDTALFHLTQPSDFWVTQQGCELLRSSALNILPRSAWAWAIQKKLVSGPWYRCPATALGVFPRQEARHLLATVMPYWEKLPSLGLTAVQLEKLGAEKTRTGSSGWNARGLLRS